MAHSTAILAGRLRNFVQLHGETQLNSLQSFYAEISEDDVTKIKTETAAGTKSGIQSFVAKHCPDLEVRGSGPTMSVKICADASSHGTLQDRISGLKSSSAFSMQRLQHALEDYLAVHAASKKQVKTEVRNLGVNLATGKIHGSPQRLRTALSGGAPRASKKHVKAYPLVKACLVEC